MTVMIVDINRITLIIRITQSRVQTNPIRKHTRTINKGTTINNISAFHHLTNVL
jgi:hypothetical protein